MRISILLEAMTGTFETDVNRAMKRAQRDIERTARKMKNVGRSMSVALTAPIVGFGALTVRAAGDFELAMNRVQALSGSTGDELESMRELAKDMGRDTQFSASQAADAMGFLAMAGFDANQTIAALPGTLQLAASAQMELATAADIVSNVLSGYRLEISELGRVNDVLVRTFTSTNTNLEQLGGAMKMAGPVAAAAGVQFEEAAAAIGLMGNAGIQATMAGTSLRGAIAKILNPTSAAAKTMEEAGLAFTDAQGRLLPLADIVRQLEPFADDAGLMMELFGQRAGPAMAALVGMGADSLTGLTTELEGAGGTAERISAAQMQGFNGAMKEMRSAIEGLQIAIADSGLLEFTAEIIRSITEWTRSMSEASPETLRLITIIGGVTAVVGPVIIVLGSLVSAFGKFLPVLSLVAKGVAALAAVGVGPLALLAAAVTAVVVVWRNWDKIGPMVGNMVESVTGWLKGKLGAVLDWVSGKVDAVTGAFGRMYDRVVGNSYVPDMVDGIESEFGRLDSVMTGPAESAVGDTSAAFEQMGGRVRSGLEGALEGAFDGATSSASDMADSIIRDLNRMMFRALAVKPIMDSLFGADGNGGIIGTIGNAIGGAFGGSRDSGGRGYPGMAYAIGTGAQPEMFIPDTAGTFVPASQHGSQAMTFQTIVQAPQGRITRESEGRARAMQMGQAAEYRRRNS